MASKATPKSGSKQPTSRPKTKNKRTAPNCSLSDDDAQALDSFCKGVTFDEVALMTWEESESSLDLTVPLFLSPEEAASGAEKTLSFSRTTKASPKGPCTRQPVRYLFSVPPQSQDQQSLILEGQGDQAGERRGNLKVIIRIM